VNSTQLAAMRHLARLSAPALAVTTLSWFPAAAHANTACADLVRMGISGATSFGSDRCDGQPAIRLLFGLWTADQAELASSALYRAWRGESPQGC
jgi:hypothetical protein